MKRITICVLLILFLLTTKQYAQWEWYNPIPNTNGMRSTQILSDSVFIILDTHGNVFKTEDNGSSFNNITVYSDAFYPLIMKFTSINKGWFIGLLDYDKTILVSTNDGCKSYNLELEGNLTSIFFLNEYIGWIADSDTIYFTNNGGKNWEQLGNIESNFVKMYFLDNETGYAIAWGSWGYNAIYKTTDGGYNWTKIHNGEPVENYESIYFINDSLGYVCGSKSLGTTRGIIVNTSDGGNDWNLQEIYDYHNIYSIKFISESVGFFNGYGFGDGKWNVGISKTIDAGEVWNKVVTIPDDKNEFLVGELDIFENKKIVTVFGNNSIILSSEDSGNSWNALTKNIFKELIGNENQNFKSICFPTENVGFLSTEKAIFKTVDAGLNWSLIKESNLNHISACDELNIWAVGDNANIIRSKDGGDTWEKIIIDIYDFNSFNWDKVEVINENEIIIFGSIWIEDMYSGGYYISSILKTIDSGENWVFATVNGTYSRIDDVFFLSKMKGWAIGNHIIHTSDGGHTWKKIDNFSDYIGLNCIYFHSDLLGFSAGFG
ncbi:MAG: WD40/YVTN/BNR-like repeat-containing protein, partial [Candidatus Hodarchaeota archaeon]